jgi:hypothetical protein
MMRIFKHSMVDDADDNAPHQKLKTFFNISLASTAGEISKGLVAS